MYFTTSKNPAMWTLSSTTKTSSRLGPSTCCHAAMLPCCHQRRDLPAHLRRYHRYSHIIRWGHPPQWPRLWGSCPPRHLSGRELTNYIMGIPYREGPLARHHCREGDRLWHQTANVLSRPRSWAADVHRRQLLLPGKVMIAANSQVITFTSRGAGALRPSSLASCVAWTSKMACSPSPSPSCPETLRCSTALLTKSRGLTSSNFLVRCF